MKMYFIINQIGCVVICLIVFPHNEVCVVSETTALIGDIAATTDLKTQIRRRFVRTLRGDTGLVKGVSFDFFRRRIGPFKSFLQVPRCDSRRAELCVWGSR